MSRQSTREKVLSKLEPHAADHQPTTDDMVGIDQAVALMSLAISMKRIADRMEDFYQNGFTQAPV